MNTPLTPDPLQQRLNQEQRDRARDLGHYNQYGLRSDPRAENVDRANPGTGDHARRFGASGDPATYANRAEEPQSPPLHDTASDAPADHGAP